MKYSILHQSEALVIVDKPHGCLTTPARDKDDPRPCLGRELQKDLGRRIFPVHRLDFEVGGLTVWALDPKAHTSAQKWFEHNEVEKLYEAFSAPRGEVPESWIEWKSNLVRGKKRSFEGPHGKPSLTRARVVERRPDLWKWELLAVTGRPHQLRYEMMKNQFPIMGDVLYGGIPLEKDFIALRAVELNFEKVNLRFGLPAVCRGPGLRDLNVASFSRGL